VAMGWETACEINETKLQNHLGVLRLDLAGEETVRAVTQSPVGFAGPVGLRRVSILLSRSNTGMERVQRVRGTLAG